MHVWGDGWQHWDDMPYLVAWVQEQMTAAGLRVTDVKEKFGTLRVYCDYPDKRSTEYRAVYAGALKKWSHLRAEILVSADWPEFLRGLVDPDTCDHKHTWHGLVVLCGVCGVVRE